MDHLLLLLLSVLLVAANAFFVLSEFALVKVRPTQLDDLIEKGSRSAKLARHIVSHLDAYLSTIQLGITVASLGLGWVAEPAFAHFLEPVFESLPGAWSLTARHSVALGFAFALITALHVVLGELVPKSMAIRSPEWYARLCARPLQICHIVFFVPMYILNGLALFTLGVFGGRSKVTEYGYTVDELRKIVASTRREGLIDLADLILFEKLIDFGRMTLRQAMRPLSDLETWSSEQTARENLLRLRGRGHSRFPLKDRHNEYTRYLHIKDVAYEWAAGTDDPKPAFRRLPALPSTTRLDDAFRLMQKERSQMVLVFDTAGEPIGIATTEDIIEEIFGEIRDEFETTPGVALATLFESKAADVAVAAKDKKEVIRHLASRLCRIHPGFDSERVIDAVLTRERLVSTAIGKGVAIPHARLSGITAPLFTIGIAAGGVEYQTPDEVPVTVVFLLLTPENSPHLQIRLLSKLSWMLLDDDWLEKIRKAQSAGELADILRIFDQMT